MSNISQHSPKARATDHAVRRYAERHLGVTVETEDDRVAVNLLRAKGVDLARIRARIADIGGVIMSTGRTSGDCIAFPEALRFRLVDGKVVTVMARIGAKPPLLATPAPAEPRKRSVLELGGAA